jgi:hypothetical protein
MLFDLFQMCQCPSVEAALAGTKLTKKKGVVLVVSVNILR